MQRAKLETKRFDTKTNKRAKAQHAMRPVRHGFHSRTNTCKSARVQCQPQRSFAFVRLDATQKPQTGKVQAKEWFPEKAKPQDVQGFLEQQQAQQKDAATTYFRGTRFEFEAVELLRTFNFDIQVCK